MNEEWRPVVGAPDYEVSNLGRVRSLKFGKVRVLRPCVNAAGYHNHTLFVDKRPVFTTAHVLVMAAFVRPRPDGLEVCHWDGNPANNALSNLRYDTPQGNAQDRKRHGRGPGSKSHCANGHEFTPENTYYYPRQRVCKTCHKAKTERYLAKRRNSELSQAAS